MSLPILVWLDLTQARDASGDDLRAIAGVYFRVHRAADARAARRMLRDFAPQAVCVEFDYPSVSALAALQGIKTELPSVPILMLTDYHTEPLAVWALRARVWDYLVKPVASEEFARCLQALAKVRSAGEWTMPLDGVHEYKGERETGGGRRIRQTVDGYMQRCLGKKISQKAVAGLCGMSVSHFSRIFHQVYGVTFQEFVLRARIDRAAKLLEDWRASPTITHICYEVGFKDLAYFGRVFRRYKGICPSEYRKHCLMTRGRSGGTQTDVAPSPAHAVEQAPVELAYET